MYKKIWIVVISVILILMFSESIVAEEILFAKIELKDGSVIAGKIQEPLEIVLKALHERIEVKVEARDIVSIVRDPTFAFWSNVRLKDGSIMEAIVEVEQIRIRPVWSRYYSLPENLSIRWEDIRSVWFFAKMTNAISSAMKVGLVEPGSTWHLQSPLRSFTTSKGPGPKKIHEFCEEFSTLGPWRNIGGSSGPSLVAMITESLEFDINAYNTNTIFLIHPENLSQLDEMVVKYPELVPVAYNELIKAYSAPLLYFLPDTQTGRIRGIIIAERLNSALAKLLIEKPIPLGVPFRYENIISPFWQLGDERLKILNE